MGSHADEFTESHSEIQTEIQSEKQLESQLANHLDSQLESLSESQPESQIEYQDAKNKSLRLDVQVFTSQTIIPTHSLLDNPSNVPHFIHTIPSHSQKSKSHAPLTLVIVKPNLVKIYSHLNLLWKWRVTGGSDSSNVHHAEEQSKSMDSMAHSTQPGSSVPGSGHAHSHHSSFRTSPHNVLILKGWLIDESRVLLLERHTSLGYTLLKLYCRVWNPSEGQTELRASLVEMHTVDVCVSAGGFLTYTKVETINLRSTRDKHDRRYNGDEKIDRHERMDKSESWAERLTEKITERITERWIDRSEKDREARIDSMGNPNYDSKKLNGIISLWTWKSPWKVEKVLEMRVENVRVLGLSDEAKWFGFATDTDVQVLQWKATEKVASNNHKNSKKSSSDSTLAIGPSSIDSFQNDFHSVFEFGGSTGYQESKDKFVEMRFSRESGDILPGPTTRTTSVHQAEQSSTWFSNRSPRRRKKLPIMPFEIVGKAPNVDHPTFLNSKYASSCHVLIHKRMESSEKIVAIHFIRNVSSKAEFETSDTEGMRCIISTGSRGYVYDIKNMKLITQFEYGGECLMSATNSYFLFSLYPGGIEVWSVLGSAKGCMIGFHPFIGLKQVVATNQSVMLLSHFSNDENLSLAVYSEESDTTKPMIMSDMRHIDKLGEKGSLIPFFSAARFKDRIGKPKVKEYSYNIYILDLIEISDLYDNLLETAQESPSDPTTELTIIQGAHSLLECKYNELMIQQKQLKDTVDLIRLHIDVSNYTLLLSRSFGFLGDAYMKVGQYRKAAPCYVRSDRSIQDVCEKYFSSNAESELLVYLESVLFNENNFYECSGIQNDELGNRILSVYYHYQPQALSKVILDSNLKCYDDDKSIHYILLQNGIQDEEDDFSTLRPRDAFALGLLYLRRGEVKNAISAFSNDYLTLIEFCVMHSSLFIDANPNLGMKCRILDGEIKFPTSIPSLGVVLRMAFPWTFLQILLRFEETLSWKSGIDYINVSPNEVENGLLCKLYLTHYFQITKSNQTKSEIASTLYTYFLQELLPGDNHTPDIVFNPDIDLGTLMCWTSESLVARRHSWLNALYPKSFVPSGTILDIQSRLKNVVASCAADDEDLAQNFIGRTLSDTTFRKSVALLSLEGLMSIPNFPVQQIPVSTLESTPTFEGKNSIMVILYYLLNDSRRLIGLFHTPHFESYPPTTLVYVLKSYCTSLDEWQQVIHQLFSSYKEYPRIHGILCKVLDHIASKVTLENFLSLLPKNTNIKFVLPFLKKTLSGENEIAPTFEYAIGNTYSKKKYTPNSVSTQ